MIIIIGFLKLYDCFRIVGVRLEYLKPYNFEQIICIR